jgi:hypothetical protein
MKLAAGFVFVLTIMMATADLFALQGPEEGGTCDTIRYLMAEDTTPYDLELGGGIIQPGQAQVTTVTDDHYADIWSFLVERPKNSVASHKTSWVDHRVSSVSLELNLEMRLFTEWIRSNQDGMLITYW